MAFDEKLAARIRKSLARRKGITEKKMFGGIGFLLNGNMCVGVWRDFLILRLGEEKMKAALTQPGVRPFDITGRPMTGWVMIEAGDVEDSGKLSSWVDDCLAFASSLPKKSGRSPPVRLRKNQTLRPSSPSKRR